MMATKALSWPQFFGRRAPQPTPEPKADAGYQQGLANQLPQYRDLANRDLANAMAGTTRTLNFDGGAVTVVQDGRGSVREIAAINQRSMVRWVSAVGETTLMLPPLASEKPTQLEIEKPFVERRSQPDLEIPPEGEKQEIPAVAIPGRKLDIE